MARAGLGPGWTCAFANDFSEKKAASYRENWGDGGGLLVGDVAGISAGAIPGEADLAWASFPCQDLSIAGTGAGLDGARSGSFWPFWNLMRSLMREGRGPRTIVLENVCGALTAHGGRDYCALCDAIAGAGYRYGALVMDAALFVPQSRPRLFMAAVREDVAVASALVSARPIGAFHTKAIVEAYGNLDGASRAHWIWWNVPAPAVRLQTLSDCLEHDGHGLRWHSGAQTARLLGLMAPGHLAKIELAKRAGGRVAGCLYKRMRADANGARVQRAEVRFDGVAGCLRTPAGGSSRQVIIVVDGSDVRSRPITARETARLMGLPDSYVLPARYSDAYHLTGDGVAVPVVRHLAAHLLEPLLEGAKSTRAA